MNENDDRTGADHDSEIVARVLGGEVESFRVLVERYQVRLLCFVRNLIADQAEAEDVAQEAFLIAFANLARFNLERGRFSAWLFTIARNCSLNAIAKKRPQPVADLDRRGGDQRDGEVDSEVTRRESLRRLDSALEALPDKHRVAFVLAEIMGFTLSEVAAIEAIPIGTVKSRVSRAKTRLKQALGEQ